MLPRDPLSAITDAFTSLLFGKSETTRPPVRTSTGQAQAVYLPTAAPGLGDSGVIIGREVYSGKGYIYDPFQLYGQQLPAPHWLVLGESGNGKSALEKTYVLRQLRFRDRQVVVLDAQGEDGAGEWNLIAEQLGITPVRLDPMAALEHAIRLNPLDPAITATGQLALLRTIIEVAMGHGLNERSGFALKVAHAQVVETVTPETAGRQPILSDIVERLRHPRPESALAMNVAPEDVRAWGLDVALVLDRLVDGDLRGMFDGPTTVGIDLDAPLTVFDLSHIDRNSIAMPILMAIVGVWLEHTWIRPDRKKRIFLVEEAWHIINSPFVAQLFQRLLKFGRRLGLSFVAVVHHLSDVVDGAAAREAAAILKMASTRTIYAQKSDEARATGAVLGLPRWAVEIIPTLTPGMAVWDVNGNVQVVKHLVTEAERPLVFTDRAMTEVAPHHPADAALAEEDDPRYAGARGYPPDPGAEHPPALRRASGQDFAPARGGDRGPSRARAYAPGAAPAPASLDDDLTAPLDSGRHGEAFDDAFDDGGFHGDLHGGPRPAAGPHAAGPHGGPRHGAGPHGGPRHGEGLHGAGLRDGALHETGLHEPGLHDDHDGDPGTAYPPGPALGGYGPGRLAPVSFDKRTAG